MPSQMDATQSFTYITDNVPLWLVMVDDLMNKCEIQYERFTRVTRHGEIKLSRKKKTTSTESLRPGKDIHTTVTLQNNISGAAIAPEVPGPTTVAPTETPAVPSTLAQEIPRKRRAGSSLSGAPSTHIPYRSQGMIVVFYDSEIQTIFETLVKNIARARNSLRKGKNTATFKSRMATMGLGFPPYDDSTVQAEALDLDPKALLTKTRLARQPAGHNMKCFEDADKDLEVAQNLCERASHQFLRDGNCFEEIEDTRKRFINCGNVAKRELERLRNEEQNVKVRDVASEGQQDDRPLAPVLNQPDEKLTHIDVIIKMSAPPPMKDVNFVGTGAIEIDDECSDAESLHFDLSAIRRTVRSTRV